MCENKSGIAFFATNTSAVVTAPQFSYNRYTGHLNGIFP